MAVKHRPPGRGGRPLTCTYRLPGLELPVCDVQRPVGCRPRTPATDPEPTSVALNSPPRSGHGDAHRAREKDPGAAGTDRSVAYWAIEVRLLPNNGPKLSCAPKRIPARLVHPVTGGSVGIRAFGPVMEPSRLRDLATTRFAVSTEASRPRSSQGGAFLCAICQATQRQTCRPCLHPAGQMASVRVEPARRRCAKPAMPSNPRLIMAQVPTSGTTEVML